MATARRQFTSEFKLEAVRLVTEGGRSVPQAARERGVRPGMLRNWKRQAEGPPNRGKTSCLSRGMGVS